MPRPSALVPLTPRHANQLGITASNGIALTFGY
jgi:hypothetical protein